MRRREPVWWRTGFGLGIIAAGQLVSVLDGADPAQGRTILHFPALRLLGLLVLAAGLTRYTRRLVRDRRDREAERAEKAAVAAHVAGSAVTRDPQRGVQPLGHHHAARPPGLRAAASGRSAST